MLLEAPAPPRDGTLRFIRYGCMPNRLGYGGGGDGSHRTLFEYAVAGVSDDGLMPLLRRFTGALPYLQLISRANAIAEPFDARVVEAYWLGNELLDRVEVRQLHDRLFDRFGGPDMAARSHRPVRKSCEECGGAFEGPPRRRYCSHRCKVQARARRATHECPRCGATFTGRIQQRYCSRRCAAQAARSAHLPTAR